jgi:hypothetical protein
MKQILWTVITGGAISGVLLISGSEVLRMWGAFAVLSTAVMALAAWVVTSDHTPASHHDRTAHSRAA